MLVVDVCSLSTNPSSGMSNRPATYPNGRVGVQAESPVDGLTSSDSKIMTRLQALFQPNASASPTAPRGNDPSSLREHDTPGLGAGRGDAERQAIKVLIVTWNMGEALVCLILVLIATY